MITFYPRNIELWRSHFWFAPELLSLNINEPFEEYETEEEFFDFLKLHGIKFDDTKYPLQFSKIDHHIFGSVDEIVQCSVIGWCKWE